VAFVVDFSTCGTELNYSSKSHNFYCRKHLITLSRVCFILSYLKILYRPLEVNGTD
jgi:hypothetical protein